jgi:NADH-quinone oxidoreductase subunit J
MESSMALFAAFMIFAFAAFISSLFLIFHPKTIPASLGMAGVMVSLAGIYGLLHFPFFSFIQVILYAGAVMVMIVYLIMAQGFEEKGKDISLSQTVSAYILSVAFMGIYSNVMVRSRFNLWAKAEAGFGALRDIGVDLIKNYGVPFEILSVLLVVAMVGAVILSKRSIE